MGDAGTGYLRPLLDKQKSSEGELGLDLTRQSDATEKQAEGGQKKKETSSQLLNVTSLFQAAKSDRERLRIDQQLTISALLVLTLMMFQNISVWYYGGGVIILPTGIIIPNDDFTEWVFYCSAVSKGLTAALSIVSICLLGKYYRLLLSDKRREWSQQVIPEALGSQKTHRYRFASSSLLWKFLFEVFIHLLFPYPWMAKTQPTMYYFLQLGMFLRLYLVARLLHTSSAAFRKRNFLRSFYVEFRKINWSIKWNLTLKILFYEHSVAMVSLCTFVTLWISAFALFILERKRQENHDFSDLGNCLWFSFVTFTTIGYGDMTPKTVSGRILTAILGLVGQVILAVFGGVVTNKLTPSKQQQMVVSFLDSETGGRKVRNAAATLIQAVWRATSANRARARKNGSKGRVRSKTKTFLKGLSKHKENQVYAAVKKFRTTRCQTTSIEANDPVIDHKLDALQNDMEELTVKMNAFMDLFAAGDDDDVSNNHSSNGNGSYQRSPTMRGSPTFRGVGGRLSGHRASNSSNKNIFSSKSMKNMKVNSVRDPKQEIDLGGIHNGNQVGRKRVVSFARKNSSSEPQGNSNEDDFKIQLEGSSIFDARSSGSSSCLEVDSRPRPRQLTKAKREVPSPLNLAREDRMQVGGTHSEVASSDSWDKPEDSDHHKLLEVAASLINPVYTPLQTNSQQSNPLRLASNSSQGLAGPLISAAGMLNSPNRDAVFSNNSSVRFPSPDLVAYKMPLCSPHSNKSLASPSLLPSPASATSFGGVAMVPFPPPPPHRGGGKDPDPIL